MTVTYDGTDFHGWQNQPGMRTVQGLLEEVIQRSVRHRAELIGSGRTDAGVHAAGQACNFRTDCSLDCGKLLHSLGSRLPQDLALSEMREVHPDFHATRGVFEDSTRGTGIWLGLGGCVLMVVGSLASLHHERTARAGGRRILDGAC